MPAPSLDGGGAALAADRAVTTSDAVRAFAALHRPGQPLVLHNAWDAGSARTVAESGALAVGTSSLAVAGAQGFADGEAMPLDLALGIAARIVAAVEVPVTVDFEGGYAVEPEEVARNVARLAEAGAAGLNLEDRVVGGEGLHPAALQAERIAAAKGAGLFVNARTDLFLQAPVEEHAGLLDAAAERAAAYAAAGADGFFVPGLMDLGLIAEMVRRTALPLNVMAMGEASSVADLAGAGVARVSRGPGPWLGAMQALRGRARDDGAPEAKRLGSAPGRRRA